MKKILSILLLTVGVCLSANAQVKAGDIVSGQIWDDLEPLMMVNVVEIDHNNRIVAAGVTDINGNFSFKIVNPKDKIRISYIGCETKILPITKKALGKIVLANQNQIQEVVVKAVKKTQTSGLSIPVTEISVAQQTIDMKEFEGLAMTSVDEALQGRISGLDIVANSGNLGAGTTMRLRGVSTINGNAEPLIVVNGNVFATDANEGFDYANANEDKFAELLNVNPEDIESISVLKDAAATAIWGSQGANGVIEIKTKRGARGKTKVNYSYRFSGSWQPKGYKLLSGDDYTMFLKEAYFNTTQNPEFATAGNLNYIPEIAYNQNFSEYQMYNNNTDWVDAITQFGQNHQHYVALTGGGEKANFRVSGGYDHQTGTIIKQVLNRFTTRVALDYFVSDRITIRTNFDLTHTKNQKNYDYGGDLLGIARTKMPNLSIYQQDQYGNDLGEFYTMNPYLTAAQAGYNAASGEHAVNGVKQRDLLKDQYAKPNPVALGELGKRDWTELKLSPEFILQYKILGKDADRTRLDYEGQIIFDIYSRGEDTYLPGSLIATNWSSSDSYNAASSYSFKQHGLSTRHTLTFTPHFRNEDHSLLAMARFNYTSGSSSQQNNGQKWLPTVDGITSPLAGGIITNFSTGAGAWKSQYLLFQLHYAYKGRYIFDATLRRDGSTKFGPSSRWGNFPGLSARWNISDEPWMKWSEKWLSMLSIRPGWGIVGNQPGQEGLYYSKYATGGSYLGVSSVVPSNIRLAALMWEKTETYNLGFDFGFLDGKIDGDLSIYTKKTTQLLHYGFAIPSSSGFGSLANKNEGTIRNNGWEFNINGHRIVTIGKKFSMDFNITFANSRNKILEMDETLIEGYNGDFAYNNGTYLSRVQLNNPLGAVYGFRSKGVYAYSNIPKVLDKVTKVESYVDMDMSEINQVYLEDGITKRYTILENGGRNAPVVRTANGDVVYNASGTPKKMYFDYNNGTQYEFVGGDAIYEDINNDGSIDELDIVYLGSTLPKLTGGFGVKFNYGPWSMNLQFNYRYGNKCINYARMNLENMTNNNNQSQAVNWRWHTEGDEALLPRAATSSTGVHTYNYLGSDRFVEDASFLRLNYAQLSYTFTPQTLKKVGIASLRLNLIVNNVFCITKYSGYDPEHPQAGFAPASDNDRTPRSKSFTVGASISF